MIASVRRAVFMSDEHAAQVKEAIASNNFQTVLILGTSEKMVNQIAETLGIAPVGEIIRIEDVSSGGEIEIAKSIRIKQGKHVIPAPTFEVKKHFSGYFMQPWELLNILKPEISPPQSEKTVMRPTFSYLGKFNISDKAIADICAYKAKQNPEVAGVPRVSTSTLADKSIVIEADLVLFYPVKLDDAARAAAKRMKAAVEKYTSINVDNVVVNVKGIRLR